MGFAVLSAASSCTRPSFFSPSGTDLSALSAAIPSLISSGASVNFLVCGSMHQSRHRHVPLMVLKSTKRRNSGSLPPRHSHGETLSGAMVGDERGTGTSWDLVHIGRGAPVQVRNTRSQSRGLGGGPSTCRSDRRLSPEVLKSIRRKLRVAHGVLDVLVPEPGL